MKTLDWKSQLALPKYVHLCGFLVLIFLNAGSSASAQVQASRQNELKLIESVLAHTEKITTAVTPAVAGEAAALFDLNSNAIDLMQSMRLMRSDPLFSYAVLEVDEIDKSLRQILNNKELLLQRPIAMLAIRSEAKLLLATVDRLKLQASLRKASKFEFQALDELAYSATQIENSAMRFMTLKGVDADAVFELGKNLNVFDLISRGLRYGDLERRLIATKSSQILKELDLLDQQFGNIRRHASGVLGSLQNFVASYGGQLRTLDHAGRLTAELKRIEIQAKQ